jgi:hypothetical protein
MTKTEAAETIALRVVVNARKTGQVITKTAVEETMSELGGGHHGAFLAEAAKNTNWRTALRIATALAKGTGDYHLIAR